MYCEKCGAQMPDDATFCKQCGNKASADGSQPSTSQPTNEEPQIIMMNTVKNRNVKGIAIAIVVLLLIAGAGFYVANNYGHSAGIEMMVHSTHITETVDVQFYVDGELKMTVTDLEPGDTCWNVNYFMVNFGILKDSKLITVKAVATGGGLGTTSDSEDIIITDGGRYTIDLYI